MEVEPQNQIQTETKPEVILKLSSSDGQIITIDSKSAERALLLKGLIQDYTEESDIPIPDVCGATLSKIVEYLIHYKDSEPKEIPKPLPSSNLLDVTDEWDINFINSVDYHTCFDLITACNYMDCRALMDLACARIAALMKEKPVEELRDMWGIENDLTAEELKEWEEYQI